MSKRTNHVPPALKHGIYSGIGLLPGEDPAALEKFKRELFDELVPVARARHSAIYAKLEPPLVKWKSTFLMQHEPEIQPDLLQCYGHAAHTEGYLKPGLRAAHFKDDAFLVLQPRHLRATDESGASPSRTISPSDISRCS